MGDSRKKYEENMDSQRIADKLHENIEIHFSSNLQPETGNKFSQSKVPVSKIFKQFPLALEAIAKRSALGHEKYKDSDQDWMNFKRVPNAIEQYEDAAARHLLKLGDEEDDFEHLVAEVWNKLAIIQLKLEKND